VISGVSSEHDDGEQVKGSRDTKDREGGGSKHDGDGKVKGGMDGEEEGYVDDKNCGDESSETEDKGKCDGDKREVGRDDKSCMDDSKRGDDGSGGCDKCDVHRKEIDELNARLRNKTQDMCELRTQLERKMATAKKENQVLVKEVANLRKALKKAEAPSNDAKVKDNETCTDGVSDSTKGDPSRTST
jgi:molecular chaperone GrpE (heat shock protein)